LGRTCRHGGHIVRKLALQERRGIRTLENKGAEVGHGGDDGTG